MRELKALRVERSQRRERQGAANINIGAAEKSGKQVIVVNKVSFAHQGGRELIKDFSMVLQRGDRIGLLGANGSGKTTLLKLLLGDLQPTKGTIEVGTKLEVAYFDQLRHQLDPEKTVIENVGEGSDTIMINGQSKHVLSYLGDFLFSPQRARTPVKALSGGERARLLLAKLFTRPANLLVLDEPTNDLDVETLELLEEVLMEFKGTVLIVSHDRAFLDNVVTSTLVFDGSGKVREYVGGFDDWLRQGGSIRLLGASDESEMKEPVANSLGSSDLAHTTTQKNEQSLQEQENDGIVPKKKLSYKLQRELDAIPAQIDDLETELAVLHEQVSQADFYLQTTEHAEAVLAKVNTVQEQLDVLIERWAELDS